MLNRFKIDHLFLFLGLSLVFIWLAFPQVKQSLLNTSSFIVQDVDLSKKIEYPKQGQYKNGEIKSYNKNVSLLYSIDGGDNFHKANENQINISAINNRINLYQNTSIRWRHAKGNFPTLKSIVVKLRDNKKRKETNVKVFTYFDSIPTTLPVVSLTMPESYLFDWNDGIMIAGLASSYDTGFHKDWWYKSANFAKRGHKAERTVFFQFFKNGQLQVEQKCQMKISGNATRYFPQKSMKLKPIDASNKKTKLAFPFFGDNGNKKTTSILLRQSGNDNNKTMFADLLLHKLAQNTNVLIQNGYPVSVFINGNYWGIYNLRERIDPYFIAKKEKVKEKEITILFCEVYGNVSLLKSGDEKDKNDFDSLIANLPTDDHLDEEQYQNIKKKISIKSFMDYIVFETYFANQDWLYNNTTWYKAKNKKWKWVLNDLDYSMSYPNDENVNSNLFLDLAKSNSITAKLFNTLMKSDEFKTGFKTRVKEIIQLNLADNNIDKLYKETMEVIKPEIKQQINRWRFIDSYQQWEKDCQKNVTFLHERRTIYQKQVDSL